MADLLPQGDHDYESLQRENKYLLRLIGGLWAVLFFLVVAGFSYWINNVDTKIERLWDLAGARGERIGNLEHRVTQNDTTTKRAERDVESMKVDLWRIKSKLNLD